MKSFLPRFDILPAPQAALWRELAPLRDLGFVLYGGTAIALRLGHRHSVDFDFITSLPLDRVALKRSLPWLACAAVLQDEPESLTVLSPGGVKVSFLLRPRTHVWRGPVSVCESGSALRQRRISKLPIQFC